MKSTRADWLTFLALNAPAAGGKPIGQGSGPGGDAPTIWEGWKEISDVMLPDGKMPTPWGSPPVIPQVCQGLAAAGTPPVKMVCKTQHVLSAFDQP
mgnify:CR=1 FL=1